MEVEGRQVPRARVLVVPLQFVGDSLLDHEDTAADLLQGIAIPLPSDTTHAESSVSGRGLHGFLTGYLWRMPPLRLPGPVATWTDVSGSPLKTGMW